MLVLFGRLDVLGAQGLDELRDEVGFVGSDGDGGPEDGDEGGDACVLVVEGVFEVGGEGGYGIGLGDGVL